jgi:hypothetical protein
VQLIAGRFLFSMLQGGSLSSPVLTLIMFVIPNIPTAGILIALILLARANLRQLEQQNAWHQLL